MIDLDDGYMPLPDREAPRKHSWVGDGIIPTKGPDAEQMEMVVFFARHPVGDGAPGADFINPLHEKAVRELADECQFRVIGTKRRQGLRNIALRTSKRAALDSLKYTEAYSAANEYVDRDDILRDIRRRLNQRLYEERDLAVEDAEVVPEWEVEVEALRVARETEAVVTVAEAIFFMGEEVASLMDFLEESSIRDLYAAANEKDQYLLAGWLATDNDREVMAARLGTTPGAVKVRLSRAFARIRCNA